MAGQRGRCSAIAVARMVLNDVAVDAAVGRHRVVVVLVVLLVMVVVVGGIVTCADNAIAAGVLQVVQRWDGDQWRRSGRRWSERSSAAAAETGFAVDQQHGIVGVMAAGEHAIVAVVVDVMRIVVVVVAMVHWRTGR